MIDNEYHYVFSHMIVEDCYEWRCMTVVDHYELTCVTVVAILLINII